MTALTRQDWGPAFVWYARNIGKLPDDTIPDYVADRETWEAYNWNPRDGRDLDPDAGPKPAWDDLPDMARKGNLFYRANDTDYDLRYYVNTLKPGVAEAALSGAVGAHVGTGLDGMTALLQIVEHSNLAGNDIPHVVMRDEHHRVIACHTQDDLRDILSATAAVRNKVESGHNSVLARYHTFAALRDDEAQTLEVREASAAVCESIVSGYEVQLKAAIDAYDPDALPDDLPTLKAVYVERLEAAALGRDKELRGHVTNQGVMLHPSCTDQDEAMQAVAVAYYHGSAAIRKADTADKAGKAFAKAKAAIEAVEVLNTPVIKVNGLPPTGEEYPLAQVLVSADHPNANVAGEVEIIEVRVRGGALKKDSTKYHSATDTTTDHSVELVVEPQMFASVVIRARNICGVSRAVVELRNPIQKEE